MLKLICTDSRAAEAKRSPIRMANFSRRATCSSKGLRPGGKRTAVVAEALLRHVPGLETRVEAESVLGLPGAAAD